jgi:hypothetical protein
MARKPTLTNVSSLPATLFPSVNTRRQALSLLSKSATPQVLPQLSLETKWGGKILEPPIKAWQMHKMHFSRSCQNGKKGESLFNHQVDSSNPQWERLSPTLQG